MKKLFKKLSLGVVLIAAIFFVSNTISVEPAEAYFGNWKSQTQACRIQSQTVRVLYAAGEAIQVTVISYSSQDGTRRRCVDGSGLCFWGSSCSAND